MTRHSNSDYVHCKSATPINDTAMEFRLASLNSQSLRKGSVNFAAFGVTGLIFVVYKRFDSSNCEKIQSKACESFFSIFNACIRGVSQMVHGVLACSLVFAYLAGRLCVLNDTTNERVFRFIGLHAPSIKSELPDFLGISIPL